ncbi:MAG: photosynthetic complex putative assembly protein PuhB [Pseudomonadota bacterium]
MPHDDFAVEPIQGLPETPPAGETILWQGKPKTYALARDALNMNWIAGYFVLLAIWRAGVSSIEMPFAQAAATGIPFLILGAVTCGVLLLMAWVMARTTVYTITTARVALRVGAALTVTLNLPYTRIGSADLITRKDGTGTLVFDTLGETRLSYLVLWPHVRPWRMKKTQPAMRSIPDGAKVAQIFADAAETRITQPEIAIKPATGGAVAAE